MSRFLEPTPSIIRHRDQWQYRGNTRPPFAIEPKPNEESVWDYPRPPRIAPDLRKVEILHDDLVIGSTNRAIRVLETASPPTFYISPADIQTDALKLDGERSFCEWKGDAVGLTLSGSRAAIGWCYPVVFPEFEAIEGWFAFYPGRMTCLVDNEPVRPQPGRYYGGWITNELVGPFKGEAGCDGL